MAGENGDTQGDSEAVSVQEFDGATDSGLAGCMGEGEDLFQAGPPEGALHASEAGGPDGPGTNLCRTEP
jgi:hypothetical protein